MGFHMVSHRLRPLLDKGFGLSSRKVSKVESWILIRQLQRYTLDVIRRVYLGQRGVLQSD